MASAKSVVVVGLDTFGASVAAELASLGHDVLGIDRDAERVRAMAEILPHAVQADAQDPDALREAGAVARATPPWWPSGRISRRGRWPCLISRTSASARSG